MKDSIERHWVRFIGQRLPSMGLPAALKQHFKGGREKLPPKRGDLCQLDAMNDQNAVGRRWPKVQRAFVSALFPDVVSVGSVPYVGGTFVASSAAYTTAQAGAGAAEAPMAPDANVAVAVAVPVDPSAPPADKA